MEDAPANDDAQSLPHHYSRLAVKVMALLILATGVAIGTRYLQDTAPRWGNYVTQIALVAAAIAGFASTWQHRRRDWLGPLQRLTQAYADVRDRNAPIDSLNQVGGMLQPAAMMIAELLRELRTQQTKVAELNEELRMRVAQRTELLERRIGSLKRQSTTDKLTGLQNRRRLDEALPEAIAACRQEGTDLCVLMIDVDYFKQLNDLKGHATGDEFLRSVGQLMRSTVRAADAAFRVGGDEFVIILPGCNGASGQAFANRLISLTEALARTFKVPLPPRLSIGLSTLSGIADPSATALLAAADKALYEIKSNRPIKSRAG